jgi:hypothetical protein
MQAKQWPDENTLTKNLRRVTFFTPPAEDLHAEFIFAGKDSFSHLRFHDRMTHLSPAVDK